MKKKFIIISIIVLICMYICNFYIYYVNTTSKKEIEEINGLTSKTTIFYNTKKIFQNNNVDENTVVESVQICDIDKDKIENLYVKSKEEMYEILNTTIGEEYLKENHVNNIIISNALENFDDDFFEENNLAINMHYEFGIEEYDIKSIETNKECATIEIKISCYNFETQIPSYIWIDFIPFEKNIESVDFNIYKDLKDEKLYVEKLKMINMDFLVTCVMLIILLNYIKLKKHDKNYNVNKIILTTIIEVLIVILVVLMCTKYEIYNNVTYDYILNS